MNATQTLAVEKILIRHNFTEEEVTEILDYVENQKGDFAAKQEITSVKQDMALVKQEIESVKQNISMLKWIMGLGFGALLTIMLYLHSDMKADIKENQRLILQIMQKK